VVLELPRQSGATMPTKGMPPRGNEAALASPRPHLSEVPGSFGLQSGPPSLRSQQRMILDFGPVDRPSSPEDFSSQLAHETLTGMDARARPKKCSPPTSAVDSALPTKPDSASLRARAHLHSGSLSSGTRASPTKRLRVFYPCSPLNGAP